MMINEMFETMTTEELDVSTAMAWGASVEDILDLLGINPEELFDEDEEDFEEDYEEDFDEMGFNPYMGCYDFDC